MKLDHVFAIEVMPGVYMPRSGGSGTSKQPKLFVRRFDCNRALKSLMKQHSKARVVVFELHVVAACEPGQPIPVT